MSVQLYGGPDDGAELDICPLVGETVYVHHCPTAKETWNHERPDPDEKVPVAIYMVVSGDLAYYRGML